MKASLEQRIDCQVKCDRSIQIGAAKREIVAEDDDDEKSSGGDVHLNRSRIQKAEPIPKSRILIADRTPAKEPI